MRPKSDRNSNDYQVKPKNACKRYCGPKLRRYDQYVFHQCRWKLAVVELICTGGEGFSFQSLLYGRAKGLGGKQELETARKYGNIVDRA